MRILFCGVGALGSHTLMLCRNLEAELRVVDFDRVESKNLAAQWYVKQSVGKHKAEAVRLQLANFYGVKAEALAVRLAATNAAQLLAGCELAVDCFDNADSRIVLAEAARARGHEVRVLDTLQFDIQLSRQSPELFYQGAPVGPVDAVIPRIGASITLFGLAVVRQFEMMGVYCLNESQAIARSRDKLRCLQLLSRQDIGLPPTVYTRQAEHVPDCIERVGGPPVVVKLLEGTQGIGVVLAETTPAIWRSTRR